MFALRDATEDDLPALEQIYDHYVKTSIATFEEANERSTDFNKQFESLQKLHLPFIVAIDTTTQHIAGYAFAKPFHVRAAYRFTVEDSIYLSQNATGRGLGRILLQELIARLRITPVRQILSYMSIVPDELEDNSATCRLHRSCGFVPAGRFRRVGYKFDKWIDVVCYQLSLATPE